MSEPRMQIDDALGAAQSYLHAIKRLAETALGGEGKDYCALDLLADSAICEINEAFHVIDTMEVRPVAEYLNDLVAQAVSEVQLKADIEELHDKAKALIASFGTAEKSKGEANK